MKDVKEEKKADEKKAPKSEQTRTLILETALRLFRERGYDKTTMRAIAQEAGVSVGNAYYYFSSKEHLVQGFYDRIAEEHQAAVEPILTGGEKDLTARIRGSTSAGSTSRSRTTSSRPSSSRTPPTRTARSAPSHPSRRARARPRSRSTGGSSPAPR